MNKFIVALAMAISALLVKSPAWAADLNIQLEQPKSPTNQDTFTINFVALDIQNREIAVSCFKKGPSDGDFSQFGSAISLVAGGSTGDCQVNSGVINTQGSFQFFVRASAGSESIDSPIVSVEYKTNGPDTPVSYGKERTDCTYKIKFKTADDGGKTAKVEIYRSEDTSFGLNSSTRVGSISVGSNTEGSFDNTVPDCSKTYYYAIRAFDSTGNGSGSMGDSLVRTTYTGSTTGQPTAGAGGAIAVGESFVPSEGEGEPTKTEEAATEESTPAGEGEVLGEETTSTNLWWLLIPALVLAVIVFLIFRKKK